ncbi:hypothetical protein [Mycobacteroides abscessus]|uniref:hypothetical protein n=1 Tax=Mycobacteroides abscessus TaxID=36809 RepID=UPI0011B1E576|nr:hypothetical protein [Mycobacteroides abscessus]
MVTREPVPGGVPLRLLRGDAPLLRPDEQVWGEMLECWRAALLARNMAPSTINQYLRVLTDFQPTHATAGSVVPSSNTSMLRSYPS